MSNSTVGFLRLLAVAKVVSHSTVGKVTRHSEMQYSTQYVFGGYLASQYSSSNTVLGGMPTCSNTVMQCQHTLGPPKSQSKSLVAMGKVGQGLAVRSKAPPFGFGAIPQVFW